MASAVSAEELLEDWHLFAAPFGQPVPQHAGWALAALGDANGARRRTDQVETDVERLTGNGVHDLLIMHRGGDEHVFGDAVERAQHCIFQLGKALTLANTIAFGCNGYRTENQQVNARWLIQADPACQRNRAGDARGSEQAVRRNPRRIEEQKTLPQTRCRHEQRLAGFEGSKPHAALWRIRVDLHYLSELPLFSLREALGGSVGVLDVRNPPADWTRKGADVFPVQP